MQLSIWPGVQPKPSRRRRRSPAPSRLCVVCGTTFRRSSNNQKACSGSCGRELTRIRHAEIYARNRARIDAIKLARGCEWPDGCDIEIGGPAELEFDHLDPATKRFVIGTDGGTASWQRLVEEIAKCRVLCAIHHRRSTHYEEEEK